MNQLLFEGRSLVGIVSSIIRQDDLKVSYSRLDWERMFRLADYHKVASIVYLGVLGYREALPEKWQTRFFERYQESLLFGGSYHDSVKEVLTWLNTRKISCTLLASESVRDLYQIRETADTSPLQLLMDEENYNLAKGYLIDMGYETDLVYEGCGERMQKTPGISIALYYRLPFRTAGYQKNMRRLLESAHIKEGYQSVRALSEEDEMIFRMASAVYRYTIDELTMREVLDLQLCHKAWRDRIHMDAVNRRMEEFQIDAPAAKLLRISYMWFADKNDNYYEHLPEEMSEYDILEERLLTRGMVNKEVDRQVLKLAKIIHKDEEKERKKEERRQFKERLKEKWEETKRKLKWVFPDYHYMASIYPIVGKLPFLLPGFWIARGVRLILRSMKMK